MSSGGKSASRPVVRDDVLLGQIESLASVGLDSGGGRTRLALSESEKEGRDLVAQWMEDAGLEVRTDRIGNLFGILRGADGGLGNALMIGSHIDTVIHAGPYDGCYGVLSGLAVLRAFREAGVVPPRPLVVAAFTNEEGVRFQPDMLGSLVAVGGMPLGEALDITDGKGCTVGEALAAIGCSGGEEPGFLLPSGYLELHVEQGPRLDAEKKRIGVVEGVQGISWWRITIEGKANHAGTTPTKLRHDAGYAAALVSVFLRGLSLSAGTTLATVGTIDFEPGAVNVTPLEETATGIRRPLTAIHTLEELRIASMLQEKLPVPDALLRGPDSELARLWAATLH